MAESALRPQASFVQPSAGPAAPVDGAQLPDCCPAVLHGSQILQPRYGRRQRYDPVQLHHLPQGAHGVRGHMLARIVGVAAQ